MILIKGHLMKMNALLASVVFLFFPLIASAQGNFVTLSDIHFDPFSTCIQSQKTCPVLDKLINSDVSQWNAIFQNMGAVEVSQYGHDTNNALFNSTLSSLEERYSQLNPKFVIIGGDFLSHHFQQKFIYYAADKSYQDFVAKVFSYLSLRISQTFPNVPIFPVVGNNDSFHGDYYNSPGGDFYKSLMSENRWGQFFKGTLNKAYFKLQFPKGGYYKVSPAGEPSHLIVVLNSVLFSAKAKGSSPDTVAKAASDELQWLTATLAKARLLHQKVWLVFHIPFGIDVYDSKAEQKPIAFWSTKPVNYNQIFLNIISRYSSVIQAMITSHTHDDELIICHNILDVFAPSISPTHYNNPAFKDFTYDDNFNLIDNQTYYLDLQKKNAKWQFEYDFDQSYGGAHSMSEAVSNLFNDKDTKYVSKYEEYFDVLGADPIKPEDWTYYFCGIFYQTLGGYQHCAF